MITNTAGMDEVLAPLALLFASLYVSEIWYSYWADQPAKGKCHAKAKAMVIFDRMMDGRIGQKDTQ